MWETDGPLPLRENRTPSEPATGLQPIDEDRELIEDGVTPKPVRTTPAQRGVSPVPMKNRFAWEEVEGGGSGLGSLVMDDFNQLRMGRLDCFGCVGDGGAEI